MICHFRFTVYSGLQQKKSRCKPLQIEAGSGSRGFSLQVYSKTIRGPYNKKKFANVLYI